MASQPVRCYQAATSQSSHQATTAPGFADRLRARQVLLGSLISLPCAATAEIMARTATADGHGYDWFFVDGEIVSECALIQG